MSWSCDAGVVSAAVDTYQYLGTSFVGAVQTFLAAQCALLTPDQWPPDRTDEVLQDPVFDFVVVGAGSAGSVLANRLTEVTSWNVLLVEAGGLPTLGTEIPAMYYSTVNTTLDWNYKVEPQNKACRSYINKKIPWPRGRVLGGSSSVNAMFYVRGNARDYNEWEEAGNWGWNYDNVLEYFKKSEDVQGGNLTQEDLYKYHHFAGFMHAEVRGGDPLEDIILSAHEEIGVKKNRDINGASQMGATRSFSTIKEGRKMSTARAFLTPIKNRPNLYVITNSMVQKILFEKDSNTAKGIKLRKNAQDFEVFANKEVILSAGTINSPQLLMLSGIGPKKDLNNLGIPVRSNLSVGLNLQDHAYIPLYFTKIVGEENKFEDFLMSLYKYVTLRDGKLASNKPCRIISFLDTKNAMSTVPDIQLIIYVLPPNCSDVSDFFGKNNFNKEVQHTFKELNKHKAVIQASVVLLHPESKGIVQLRSKSPFDPPKIYANYFNEENDMKTMIAGLKRALKFGNTKAFREHGIKLEWFDLTPCRNMDHRSDEFLECWAREMTSTMYHPVGTNKMGPITHPDAVVDADLKVHGIDGLRVIDASIMPHIPRGNTNAAVIMVAEKGADIIKNEWLSREGVSEYYEYDV